MKLPQAAYNRHTAISYWEVRVSQGNPGNDNMFYQLTNRELLANLTGFGFAVHTSTGRFGHNIAWG